MPDLNVQIRSYVDAVSSPLTVDDVLEVRVGDGLVRPVISRPTVNNGRRGYLVAVVAAVVVLVVVGSVAWVSARGSEGPAEPSPIATTVPPTSTVPSTTVPSDPQAAAFEVVFDAFTAIGDADWQRFLGYLDPDGVLRNTDTGMTFRWWDDYGIEVEFPPGQGPYDPDHNGDGVVNLAEQFLLQAHYMALAPIVVSDCQAVETGVRCYVEDSEVFYAAAGIAIEPIPVTVRDGRIVEIEVRMGYEGRGPAVFQPLGRCPGCDPDGEGAEQVMREEYMEWLGIECGGGPLGCEEPLGLSWYDIWSGAGYGESPWIHPDSFQQHRDLVSQWLAARTVDVATRDTLNSYTTTLAETGHPEPAFDTTDLGSQQTLTLIEDAAGAAPEWISGPSEETYWVVAAELEGDPKGAAGFWIEVVDTEDAFFIDGIFLWFEPSELKDGYAENAWASYEVATSPAPYLVAGRGDAHFAVGGLPSETAVVVLTHADGSSSWQLPSRGLALLDITEGIIGPIRLVDAAGKDIYYVELVGEDSWSLTAVT